MFLALASVAWVVTAHSHIVLFSVPKVTLPQADWFVSWCGKITISSSLVVSVVSNIPALVVSNVHKLEVLFVPCISKFLLRGTLVASVALAKSPFIPGVWAKYSSSLYLVDGDTTPSQVIDPVAFMLPTTCKDSVGEADPIPTLPPDVILTLSSTVPALAVSRAI